MAAPEMVPPTFLAEVRRFCQTTSVRGVPRIVNSKSTLQSVIWSLGVLTCSGLLVWQMTVVFNRYLSYQVTTLLVQSPVWESVIFPDITICNLYPLVHENEMNLSYENYYSAFFTQFINMYTKYPPNFTFAPETPAFFNFASPESYFTNFPHLPHFGKIPQGNPIIGCSYYNWNGTENIDYRCFVNKFKDVQQLWVPRFYKCFKVALNRSEITNFRGFSAVVFVDDYVGQSSSPVTALDLEYTLSSGMQVLIHSPGSKPDMTLGIPIGVGMSTKITIAQTKVTHLPYPYSNCTTQKTLGVLDQITPYSVKYCTDVCLQNHYLNECGCISSSLQFTADQFDQSNYTMCGNLSINNINTSLNWKGVIQMICSAAIPGKNQVACQYKCLSPCEEYKYEMKASAAPWPHKSAMRIFYFQYIRGSTRFGNAFELYNAFLDNNLTIAEGNNLADKLDQEGQIKKSFLQLIVEFDSPSFMEQQDVATFSFDSFGAQVGGVLSLWLGVTIILIFELCEVVINFLAAGFLVKQNKQTSAEAAIDTRL